MSSYPSWINGQPASTIACSDRGFAYGDGAFETIRVHRSKAVWLQDHLERLALAMQRLAIAVDMPLLEQQLQDYLAEVALDDGVIKLVVTRGIGGRGYSGAGCSAPTTLLSAFDLPDRITWQQGIALYPCVTRLGLNPTLAGLKHLNRLEQVLARSEWDDPRYQEGLVMDLRGHLVEGTMSNLFLVHNRRLLTPELTQAGVAGIARAHVMRLAPLLGLDCEETVLTMAELDQSSELFCCNSVFGVWPVLSLGARAWCQGPVTRMIQHELNKKLND